MASMSLGIDCLSSAAYTAQGDAVVSFAESTVGVIGNRPNAVTDFYGVVCDWCSMFVYYCAANVGLGSKIPYSSFCDDAADENGSYEGGVTFFKNRNSFYYSQYNGGTYVPERGDVIYFDWPNAYGYRDGVANHTGYVRSVSDGYVYTCEGNANDMVQNRCYSLSSPDILGYGRPDYDDSTVVQTPTYQPPSTPAPEQPATEPTHPGVTGNDVSPAETVSPGYGALTYTVTSDIGAWIRYNAGFGDNKIGIVSTGTVLVSDGQSGSWLHFNSVPIEGSSVCYDGWINITTLTAGNISYGDISQTTQPTAPVTSQPAVSSGILEYGYISSNVGAWLRSSTYFGEDNKLGVLDSGANIDIYGYNGEWLYVGAYSYGTYTYGYVHDSTVQRGSNTAYENVNGWEIENSYGSYYTIMSGIGANFRQDPNEYSDIICVLPQYSNVEVMNIYGEWAFARAYIDGYDYPVYGYINTCNF